MGAQVQRQRPKTAREIAHRFGISERTVRTMIAEPRDQYLARADHKENRQQNFVHKVYQSGELLNR